MPLLLLPNVLGDVSDFSLYLPPSVEKAMARIDGLIAESEGGGRAFLKRFKTKKKPHEMPIALLNKNTPAGDMDFLLEPVIKGETWGVVTDAGLPCLADPGSGLVARAKLRGVSIEAFSGPCSITLALMLSGLSGQRFTFHGYPAKEDELRKKELQVWEKTSEKEGSTQLFIEAPFRNDAILADCLMALKETTLFCVACDLTLSTQQVITKRIKEWRKSPLPTFAKRPAIFLFTAA